MTIHDGMQELVDRCLACQQNGDVEGIVALYTDDGSIYSPYGPPAIGREAIRATFAQWVTGREINKRLDVIEACSDGHIAFFRCRLFGRHARGGRRPGQRGRNGAQRRAEAGRRLVEIPHFQR